MPKIPDSIMSKLTDAVGPSMGKLRNVNPAAAKESATRGATSAKDIVALSIDYVKQETKEPLRGAGRYLAFGAAGGVLIGFGAVLLALSLLRGIQTGVAYVRVSGADRQVHRGPWSGSLTWLPYLLTGLACAAGIGVILLARKRANRA